MAAGKQQDIIIEAAYFRDDAVGSGADLLGGFAFGAAIAKQVPIGPLGADFRGAAAFIFSVIPLDQVRINDREIAEACQLASFKRALERAREYMGKRLSFQSLAQLSGILPTSLGERQIREPGVLAS
jgi:hypothetical protein